MRKSHLQFIRIRNNDEEDTKTWFYGLVVGEIFRMKIMKNQKEKDVNV